MPVGIFETQKRSRWVQNMLVGAHSGFGYRDLAWYKRAIMAIRELGLDGEEITAAYLVEQLAPLVGYPPHKSYASTMIKKAIRVGVLQPTGRKRRVGGHSLGPSYIVAGRAKVDRSTRHNDVVLDGTYV